MQEKPPDFGKMLESLNDMRVRFVLIGGLAMVAHGSAYVTDDIDFAYSGQQEDAQALISAIDPDSSSILPQAQDHALDTNVGPIDLHGQSSTGVCFEELWERSIILDLYEIPVHVASLDDLIAMKRAAGRVKDQGHILELEALRKLVQENSDANG